MARECITIALSPSPYFIRSKTYVIHFGENGDLSTVLCRPGSSSITSLATPRICSDRSYRPYWIILKVDGTLSAGFGYIPGLSTFAKLDDSMYSQVRSGIDAPKYVGFGNSSIPGRDARGRGIVSNIKVRKIRVMPIPFVFENFIGGIPISEPCDGSNNNNASEEDKNEDVSLRRLYASECDKSRKRSIKFGTEYKMPGPDAFLRWSDARRLRANPKPGFVTGLNLYTEEEKEKARKRAERFEAEREAMGGGRGDNIKTGQKSDDDDDEGKMPILNSAWDNFEFLQKMRTDAPSHLIGLDGLPKDNVSSSLIANGDVVDNSNNVPSVVPEKVHLFTIDWAAFKQIRTDDIMVS